jgi:hypothetical protein
MNAFLVVLALGLAALDLTCFWAIKVQDGLSPASRLWSHAAPLRVAPATHVTSAVTLVPSTQAAP